MAASSGTTIANAYTTNLARRNLIVHGRPDLGISPSVDMWQPLNPTLPATVAAGSILAVQLRNVGLVKRCLVKMTGTFNAGATTTQTLTKLGLSNLISNVLFTDLANNQRLNTPAWHLVALSSVKRRRVWGAAVTTDTPFGYGNNFNCNKTPATIAATTSGTFTFFLEIPFVRNDHDLRGAIFGDVNSAIMTLQLTINPNIFVNSTSDATLAVYQSGGTDLGTLTNFAWQVEQNYLDQLPRDSSGNALLPVLDLGTAYVLTQTASTTPVVNQENTFPFVNQRQFLSSFAIYDNAGVLNAGTDILNWKVVSANFTNIRYMDPIMQAMMGRVVLGDDPPAGMYYFDFSDRPIDTSQYGNMQLIMTPTSVGGSTATVYIAWESYGIIGLINQGGAMPSGA